MSGGGCQNTISLGCASKLTRSGNGPSVKKKEETQCKKIKSITRDGTVDSISSLLQNYNHDSKQLVSFLLKLY